MRVLSKEDLREPEYVRCGAMFEASREIWRLAESEMVRHKEARLRKDWDACAEHRNRADGMFKAALLVNTLVEKRGTYE